jgi:hypothetical protein
MRAFWHIPIKNTKTEKNVDSFDLAVLCKNKPNFDLPNSDKLK